jgi:DNA-binding CsgD family transcriptional regulator
MWGMLPSVRKPVNLKKDEVKILLRIVDKLSKSTDQVSARQNIAEDMLHLLKSDFLASYVWNRNIQGFEHFVGLNVDPANASRYLNYYQFHDPVTPLLQKQRKATLVSEIMPQKDLERTEFFHDFLMKDGHHHGINLYAYEGDLNIGDLRIWRKKGKPPFGDHEAYLLDAILPYFQNALRNARVMSKANGLENLWKHLLENSNTAMLLLDERNCLVYRNKEACQIEKTVSPEEYSSFCSYVRSSLRKGIVPTKWGPFSLSILKTFSPQDARPLTALFAVRQGSEKIDADSLRYKHHLTLRETEICILVCKGLSGPEIGRVLGISFTTVRTHLKHLFAKLDVTSRSELIYRLFEGFLDTSF